MFKIGDKVKLVYGEEDTLCRVKLGTEGEIIEICSSGNSFRVKWEHNGCWNLVNRNQIVLVDGFQVYDKVARKDNHSLIGDIAEIEDYELGEKNFLNSRMVYIRWNNNREGWALADTLVHCRWNRNTKQWEAEGEPKIEKKHSKPDSHGYISEQVWAFLTPKMRQLVPPHIENIDSYSPVVKDMVVAAYRSGYGRAEKGRNYEIGKPSENGIEKQINNALKNKEVIGVYPVTHGYSVAKFVFTHSKDRGNGISIYSESEKNGLVFDDLFDNVLYTPVELARSKAFGVGDLVVDNTYPEPVVAEVTYCDEEGFECSQINKVGDNQGAIRIIDYGTACWRKLVTLTLYLEYHGVNFSKYRK